MYHLVHVKDFSSEIPSLQSIPVVNKFPKIFPNDLPRIPLDWEIDFRIDLLPNSCPISIPPYKIDLHELKELRSS